METLFLTLDTIALVVVIYFSYKAEAAPGKPEMGPFRIRVPKPAKPASDQSASGRAVRRR